MTDKRKENKFKNPTLIEWRGEKKSIRQWAKTTGINPQTISKRIRSGWDVEKALTQPSEATLRKRRQQEKEKIRETTKQMTKELGSIIYRDNPAQFKLIMADLFKENPKQFLKDIYIPLSKEFSEPKQNEGPKTHAIRIELQQPQSQPTDVIDVEISEPQRLQEDD